MELAKAMERTQSRHDHGPRQAVGGGMLSCASSDERVGM